MQKRSLSSYTEPDHGLRFSIEGADVSVDEMANWVASIIHFPSEHIQEHFAHDACHAILNGVGKKVTMAKAQAEWARIRRLWVKDNPPNHAGYYYCHIGGEWVHESQMELDHVVPKSLQKINTDDPDWQDKLRPSCGPHNFQKGSKVVPSATSEIRPPDGDF